MATKKNTKPAPQPSKKQIIDYRKSVMRETERDLKKLEKKRK